MNKLLAILILLAAFTMPALAQWQGRLSPDEQREFDKAYAKWVNDSRKNDRDDLDKDVRRMQDIMARNNIPPDVPYDQIATPAAYNNGGYRSTVIPITVTADTQVTASPDSRPTISTSSIEHTKSG